MHIESLDINKIFQNTGNSEELQPQDYTFLNENNIYQSITMVKTMLNYTKYKYWNSTQNFNVNSKEHNDIDNLLNLVSFKPDRILLQEIAAQFTVYAAVNKIDTNDRNVYILAIYRSILLSIEPLITKSNEFYELYNDKYRKLIIKYTCSVVQKKFPKLLQNIKEMFKQGTSNYSDITPTRLAIEIIVSRKYNDTIRKDIREYAKYKIFEFIKSTHITLMNDSNILPIKLRIASTISERNTLFLVGGPGSGKTSYSKKVKQELEHIGNYVEINTDSYKNLLMPTPLIRKLMLGYSQLVQTEASFIKRQALELAIKENMHMLIDQVSFSKDILEEQKLQRGIIKVIVMSTDINRALERNQIRGIGVGRFEDTYGILNKHKNTVIEVLNNIDLLLTAEYKDAKVKFKDNSNVNHENPSEFMEINCTKKQVIIKNLSLLKQFFKNKFLYIPINITDTLEQPMIYYEKTEKKLIRTVDKELRKFYDKVYACGGTIKYANETKSVSSTLTTIYSDIISTSPSLKVISDPCKTVVDQKKFKIQSKRPGVTEAATSRHLVNI